MQPPLDNALVHTRRLTARMKRQVDADRDTVCTRSPTFKTALIVKNM